MEMQNEKCEMRNAKCEMRNTKCKMQNAICIKQQVRMQYIERAQREMRKILRDKSETRVSLSATILQWGYTC